VLRALLIHATSQKSTVRHQDLAPQRLGLAILVLVVMLFLRKFGRGIWQSLAALVGIIIGKMKFPSSQIVLNAECNSSVIVESSQPSLSTASPLAEQPVEKERELQLSIAAI
jgi:hypothetical protein